MSADEEQGPAPPDMTEVWDAANPDAVERSLDPEYRRQLPTSQTIDLAGQIQSLKDSEQLPDIAIEIEEVIAAADRVAFRSTPKLPCI